MSDKFAKDDDIVFAPAREVFLITPSDTDEVSPTPKAIRADDAGEITFRTVDGSEDVTMAFAAGEVLAVRVKYLRETGTTVPAAIHGLA